MIVCRLSCCIECATQIFEEADLDKDERINVVEFLEFARKHKDLWPHVKAAIF